MPGHWYPVWVPENVESVDDTEEYPEIPGLAEDDSPEPKLELPVELIVFLNLARLLLNQT